MTSKERVKTLLDGQLPDRPPLYDVIRNDAVIEHFGGETLTPENASDVVRRAHVNALDATKSFYRLPDFNAGQTIILPSGRETTRPRWTSWREHKVYESTGDYVRAKSNVTAGPWNWKDEDQLGLDNSTANWVAMDEKSGDIVRDFHFPGPPRLDGIFPEVGLMAFCYYMADCPDIIHRQIDYRFEKVVQAIEHSNLPEEATQSGILLVAIEVPPSTSPPSQVSKSLSTSPPSPVRTRIVTMSASVSVTAFPCKLVTVIGTEVGLSRVVPSRSVRINEFSSAANQFSIITPLAPKNVPPAKVPNGLAADGAKEDPSSGVK